jgi:hypothetical protein
MRGASTVTTINQSEATWLDLRGFEDIVAWLDCKEVTVGGGAPTLTYQTAPTKDDVLFTGLTTAVTLSSGLVKITKMTMAGATVPLARWLRWQLASGGATGTWDVTFRLWIAANVGPHPLRPKINAPPIRPNGKSCNGDCAKGGTTPVAVPPSTRAQPPSLPSGMVANRRPMGAMTPQMATALRAGMSKPPQIN